MVIRGMYKSSLPPSTISHLFELYLLLTVLSEIPYVVTKGMYNTVTLMGTLSFALSLLTAVFVATQLFTFRYASQTPNQSSLSNRTAPGQVPSQI